MNNHQQSPKTAHEFDAELVQGKIELIQKGLPIDISENELQALEEILRGARSFYIDILKSLQEKNSPKNSEKPKDLEHHITEESKNLAGVELALRGIDDFRKAHPERIMLG